MGVNLVAGLWGFAEATLFIIVPDVYLGLLALRNLRRALIACLVTLAGALAGGCLMYWWGAARPDMVLEILEFLPGISPEMLTHARREVETTGPLAVLRGPLTGTPYKTFAAQAHAAGLGAVSFMLITIPARLVRFVLVTLFIHGFARLVQGRTTKTQRVTIVLMGWFAFYVGYFLLIG